VAASSQRRDDRESVYRCGSRCPRVTSWSSTFGQDRFLALLDRPMSEDAQIERFSAKQKARGEEQGPGGSWQTKVDVRGPRNEGDKA